MPGRYAKNEISGGFLGSIDVVAYRMPSAPPIGIDGTESPEGGEAPAPEATAATVVGQAVEE